MPSRPLANLVKTGALKEERPSQSEFDGLLSSGRAVLKDAEIHSLSRQSRFELSYSAAHSLALAALRREGYRSENRYVVFQSLVHTTNLSAAKARVLSDAHVKRNTIAYEGALDITDSLVESIIRVTKELLDYVEKLGPI